MKTFTISGVVLLGVLSCMRAELEEPKYNHVQTSGKYNPLKITVGQQKEILGKVVTTVADTVSGMVDKAGSAGFGHSLKYVPTTDFGVAKIVLFEEGVICSGIHLKPWIILTAAECVYNRPLEKLYVDVIIRNHTTGTGIKIASKIDSIVYHPEYKSGLPRNNFALLYNFGSFDWDVDEFKLSRIPLTPEEIVNKQLETYTFKWTQQDDEKYVPRMVCGVVTTNFSVCGEPSSPENYYCVQSTVDQGNFVKPDLGDPLFYMVGTMKRCIGIYNGWNMDKALNGHEFESITPSISWIEQFVYEHPVPPLYY